MVNNLVETLFAHNRWPCIAFNDTICEELILSCCFLFQVILEAKARRATVHQPKQSQKRLQKSWRRAEFARLLGFRRVTDVICKGLLT